MKMNNKRVEEINSYLLKFKTLFKESKDSDEFILRTKTVYESLVRINTNNNINSYDMFEKWEEYGSSINSLLVFLSKPIKIKFEKIAKPYFLCMNTKNAKLVNDSLNLHKIYLSLKPEYLEQGVLRILDFIDRENIEVGFKVGRLSRDDQTVIRVGSHEDCDKVLNFINNDQFFQMGKKEANPFSFQKDGIALAVDGDISYNDCMSKMVFKYLQHMKYNNKIDEIGYNTFVKYVKDYYEEHFIRKENIEASLRDFKINNNKLELYKLIDYKYSIKLFLEGLLNDFTYDSYKNFIDNKKEHFAEESRDLYRNFGHEDYFSLFFELCDVMINKVGYEQACFNLIDFFESNDSSLITRDNNLRRRVDNKLFINFINNHVSRSNMTIKDLIDNIYCPENDLNYDEKVSMINDGIRKTYVVHNEDGDGLYYARGALYNLIIKNKYNGFTREDGVRDRIKEYISRDDLMNIIKNETGVNIINEDNIGKVINTYLNNTLNRRVL